MKTNIICATIIAVFVIAWFSCINVTFNSNEKIEYGTENVEEQANEICDDIIEWYNASSQNGNRPRSRVRNYSDDGCGVQIREVVED